jgi:hypothetical protein
MIRLGKAAREKNLQLFLKGSRRSFGARVTGPDWVEAARPWRSNTARAPQARGQAVPFGTDSRFRRVPAEPVSRPQAASFEWFDFNVVALHDEDFVIDRLKNLDDSGTKDSMIV